MSAKATWAFREGDEIVSGKRAVRSLGGGTVFEVYLARDERRLSYVVCKLVRPDQVGDASALRQLRRESELLARLAHPVIVRSLGATLEGPRPHLVLEHLRKVTLRRWLRKRGPLPVVRVLPLALHLGSALHYLSAEGVVHLDVKPGNVVLGSPPRLIDFSVARTLDRARRIERPIGTARYLAPEQCRPGDLGDIGTATDIWGLGITLYEAIAGRRPFPEGAADDAQDAEARYPQLVHDATPLAGEIPQEIGQIVMRCLRREPAARPTAAQLVAALEPIAARLAEKHASDRPSVSPQ
jgi:serine/threonine-protein kinase